VRAAFGATWSDVVRDWCLGAEPQQEPPFTAWLAIETLDRLWPEYVDQMIASSARGVNVVNYAIHLGTILRSTEPLVGFADVLRRLRGGEQSALPELFVAANLVHVGFTPELEPTLNGNRLDCLVHAGGQRVYIEVISPERADVIVEAHTTIQALAMLLRTDNPGRKIELLVSVDVDDEAIARIREFVSRAACASAVQDIPGIGAVIVEAADGTLVVSPRIATPPDTTVLGVSHANSADGSLAAVRMPVSDHRVQRLLTAELHHFSRDETNVLVVDVGRSAGSIRSWSPQIERRFQPIMNRRLGAVVVYQLVQSNPSYRYRWQVLQNPHAYRAVPDAVIHAVRMLN
jgi:hypothetical protein